MNTDTIFQTVTQTAIAGSVSFVAYVFQQFRTELKEIKGSILDLNLKMGQILVNLENHKVRIENLEERK